MAPHFVASIVATYSARHYNAVKFKDTIPLSGWHKHAVERVKQIEMSSE